MYRRHTYHLVLQEPENRVAGRDLPNLGMVRMVRLELSFQNVIINSKRTCILLVHGLFLLVLRKNLPERGSLRVANQS